MELHQLLDIRGTARLPAVLVSFGGAVALREREEAPPERVLDELKQDEQVAGPVRQRRAREEVDRRPGGAACLVASASWRASRLRILRWFFR